MNLFCDSNKSRLSCNHSLKGRLSWTIVTWKIGKMRITWMLVATFDLFRPNWASLFSNWRDDTTHQVSCDRRAFAKVNWSPPHPLLTLWVLLTLFTFTFFIYILPWFDHLIIFTYSYIPWFGHFHFFTYMSLGHISRTSPPPLSEGVYSMMSR